MGLFQSLLTASQTSLTVLRSTMTAGALTQATAARSRLSVIFALLPANDVFASKASAQQVALSCYTLLNGGELQGLEARINPPTGPFQPVVLNPPLYTLVCERLGQIMMASREQS